MSWNHRTTVLTSSAGIAAILAVAALAVFRLSSPPTVTQAEMVGASLTGPVVGQGGQPLTRMAISPALVITPNQLQIAWRREMRARLHIRMGQKPLLIPVSASVAKMWAARHLAGVQVVKMKYWVPRADVPKSVLTMAAGPELMASRRWVAHQGLWSPAEPRPMHVSLNYPLTRALAPLAKDGAIWVLQKNGQVLAAVGTQRMLLHAAPVGLSALPPLLAEAASDAHLKTVLEGAGGIDALAQKWGSGAERQALQNLGFGPASLGVVNVQSPALPRSIDSTLLTSGNGLSAAPVQVARAYLPLLNSQGRLPALSFGAPGAATQRTGIKRGAQEDVLQALPRIKEDGIPFRIWRPAASPAVVVEAKGGTVAVLSSNVTAESLPVATVLAAHHA